MFQHQLPPELWMRILRFATLTQVTDKLFETEYRPFDDPPGEEERALLSDSDQVALALISVCRDWREMAQEFVYESVRLNHGMSALLQALRSSAEQHPETGYGKWVKRLELSIVEHEDPESPVSPLDILQLCPGIKVLVKYDDDLLPQSVGDAHFPGIKRFDWWYARYRDGDHRFDTKGDDGSRGLNFLRDIISRAPNLEYLLIAKRYSSTINLVNTPRSLTLALLTTLRVQGIDSHLRSELEIWFFPNLNTVIMDFRLLWRTSSSILNNPSIRRIELTDDEEFMESDYLVALFSTCSNLRELGYYIDFVKPSLRYPSVHASLACVRLHAKPNSTIIHATWPPTHGFLWDHIRMHFSMFKKSTFPSLEQIVLYGDWSQTLDDTRFVPLYQALRKQGIHLELDRADVWASKSSHELMSKGEQYMRSPEGFFKVPIQSRRSS
jgi:hypothetical protein